MTEPPHEQWARKRRAERAQAAHLRRILRFLPDPWVLKTPEPARHSGDGISRALVEGRGLRITLCAPLEEDQYCIEVVRIDGRSLTEEERQVSLDLFLPEEHQQHASSTYDPELRIFRYTVPIGVLG